MTLQQFSRVAHRDPVTGESLMLISQHQQTLRDIFLFHCAPKQESCWECPRNGLNMYELKIYLR